MGNSHPSVKVVLSDGTVFTSVEPITAAELMLEHPYHVVVELNPEFVSKGWRPIPLPADPKLEPKKLYVMLPMRNGKAVKLTPEEAQKLMIGIKSTFKSKALSSFTGVVPFLSRIKAGGGGTSAVLERMCLPESGDFDDTEAPPPRLPEVLSRQVSGKGWRPSLDTIMETTWTKSTVPHWIIK